MKTLKNTISLAVLMLFATVAFSQPEMEEVPMFGTTRTLNAVKTHKIEIKNTGAVELVVTSIQFPENVKVSIDKKAIPAKGSAVIVVVFDHETIKTDKYNAVLKVISEQTSPKLKTTYESTYEIKGSFVD